MNDHLARRTYRRNSYETFLLDSGNPDYSFELDFLVFDLCDKHDYLTVYDGPDQSHPVLAHETGQRENFLVYGSSRYLFLEFNATRASSRHSETIPFQSRSNDTHVDSVLVKSMLEHKIDYAGFRARLWKKCNKPGFHTRMGQCIKSKVCVCSNGVPREGLFCRQEGSENCKSCHPGFKLTKSRKCRPIQKNQNFQVNDSILHRVHDLRHLSI